MRRLLLTLLGVLVVWGGGARAAQPGASDWVENEAGKVRLVAAATATGKAAMARLGLHFQLQPGWKIYWRTPGDAGYPPKIDWTGSKNLGDVTVLWPAPKRFVLAGLQNHGYAGEVVLPLDVALPQPGKAATAKASLDYLACAQICVPMQASLSLTLPHGPAQPSDFAHLISRFAALVPGPADRHGLSVEAVEAVGEGETSLLRVTVSASAPFDHPDLFVEPPELASFDAPRLTLSADRTRLVAEMAVLPGTLTAPLAANPVTVTLVDGDRAAELTRTPSVGAVLVAGGGAGPTLWAMLGVALLGGVILNLMPCVLPVLSIKVLGALGHGGGELRHIRASFLASAAGIVVSFLALAAVAVAVKAAGAAVGWGIQFQQPAFLAVMIALLLGFALNLWGAFEIRLPSALMNVGAGGGHHTLLGHFLSGAFATLLATPCSAPFLGTAIGFALARGPAEIVAIFAALGLGMAVPYLAVAAWPRAAQALPRPGAWMVRVRQVMGVALAGTAVWLAVILATQMGWLNGRDAGAADAGKVAWTVFDRAELDRQVAAGKVVLVDVTADWCITCKVNKAAVLDRDPVAARLKDGSVVPMRADWTNPDAAIAAYLASFGRYGIPFNAVYGPKAPAGIALPELLSADEVVDALRRAEGR